ncbi:MAG TPA: NADH-quinone oxidoreductase subunit NuoF [Phycisphaerae bacterium]|nr:NADH-quinone oxidoreductase subunit NuoF [Phycisphaerae bacterium]
MTPEELSAIAVKAQEEHASYKHVLNVCMESGCVSSRSDAVADALDSEIKKRDLKGKCCIKRVGCLCSCAQGPMVSLGTGDLYKEVTPEDAPALIDALGSKPVDRLALPADHPFFTRQLRIVREFAGTFDPEDLNDSIRVGAYKALLQALTDMTPTEVIAEITASQLRGRGGAGFPTGLKWSTVAKAAGSPKYVVCNGDEGDPGAFMDRSVMEGDPHRVIEGMALAAYATGADHGYIYVRAEYPLAVKRLTKAINQANRNGLLGRNILGTKFSFDIELRLGAGAFVCGEETALLASIEGNRGLPRPRPPFPANYGLYGKPTLINNVETYANIAPIINRGGAWFASIGTAKSKGTKIFALTGKVVNTGLIEVPMGIPLRDIIFDMGGGIPDGRKFKAVQTGGPSGGCIPEKYLDLPVDYESLASVGSIMGSGGMIVMDDTSNMVDVARFFMDFCMSESCGKCIPCRVGTYQMHEILRRIYDGEGKLEDLTLLRELCDMVKATSLCGLGQTAPNPVLSTLKYFEHEYLELIAAAANRNGQEVHA